MVFIVNRFLSAAECQQAIQEAEAAASAGTWAAPVGSGVAPASAGSSGSSAGDENCKGGNISGSESAEWPLSDARGAETGRRTSRSVYPPKSSAIYRTIQERMALLGNVPADNGEPTKLTRYTGGEWYQAHDDSKSHKQYQAYPYAYRGGTVAFANRIFSLVVYLNTCTEGGTTSFHHLAANAFDQRPGGIRPANPRALRSSPGFASEPMAQNTGNSRTSEAIAPMMIGFLRPTLSDHLPTTT